jgi:hypothetical protein
MFYFPFDFVVSVQRLGCTRVVCQMNEDWSSQMGMNELALDYNNSHDAQLAYEDIKARILP